MDLVDHAAVRQVHVRELAPETIVASRGRVAASHRWRYLPAEASSNWRWAVLLTERHEETIRGVLSCYDRVIITGTLPISGPRVRCSDRTSDHNSEILAAPTSRAVF